MKRTLASMLVPLALLAGASSWLYVEATAAPGRWDHLGAVAGREPLGHLVGQTEGHSAESTIAAFSLGSHWAVNGLDAPPPNASFERVSRPLATLVCVRATERCWTATLAEPTWVWLGEE